jgi:hypothetical protein
MTRRAFSLIELIIAVAIGISLIALAIQAMFAIRTTVYRTQTLVVLNDEAAVIHRELGNLALSMHPGGMWRLSADNPDGVWGPNPAQDGQCDDVIRLTWLATVPERTARNFSFGAEWSNDVIWARLIWRGDNASGNASREPQLLLARSPPYDNTYGSSWGAGECWFRTIPQPRRDRRRDLNDNDLRFVPGMSASQYKTYVTNTGTHGDDADLDDDALPLHGPNTRVTDCAIAWVDRRGHVVGWDSRTHAGIQAWTGDGGSSEAVPGGDGSLAALDGVWLDGRVHTATGDPDTVDAMRPVLLRLTITLAETPQSASLQRDRRDAGLRAEAPSATFTFTLPLDPVLGAQ